MKVQTEIKKFTRHLTGDEMIAACEREGFPCQPNKYLNEGADHIRFGFQHGRVYVSALYNTVNGRAFGEYEPPRRTRQLAEKGIKFSTDDKLDGTPWFDAVVRRAARVPVRRLTPRPPSEQHEGERRCS